MVRNDETTIADQVASLQRAKESCSGRLESWSLAPEPGVRGSEPDAGAGERCRPR
jgi:hypothetical protein